MDLQHCTALPIAIQPPASPSRRLLRSAAVDRQPAPSYPPVMDERLIALAALTTTTRPGGSSALRMR